MLSPGSTRWPQLFQRSSGLALTGETYLAMADKVQEALDAGERMAGRIKATSAGCKTFLHPLKFKVSVSRWHQPHSFFLRSNPIILLKVGIATQAQAQKIFDAIRAHAECYMADILAGDDPW